MSTQLVDGPGAGPTGGRRKVAVVTDDLVTVSAHFGMAGHYLVYDVKGGEVVGKEARDKPGHGPMMHEHHEEGTPEMAVTHRSMLSNVADCAVIIAGGMGRPMYSSIKDAGMQVYVTRVRSADEAVRALLAGRLDNHPELLH